MRPDIAATDALADSLARLLPALESFTRFEGADPAARRTLWRAALDEPLPETGSGREAVLEALCSHVIANGLRIGAPGFSGWVTNMPTTVPAVAQLAGAIAAAQRWWATPGNFLEVLALRWLQRLVGLPDHFDGSFTSGGATANLLGLAAARQHAGESRGFDPSLDGVQRLVEPRVYASTEVHHVVHRACGVLGLGRRALRMIPVDAKRAPDLSALERFLDEDLAAGRTPVAVVASAGDVNTGAVEPVDEMREIAHARGVWLHVDGAYGGFGILDPRVAALYGDLSEIDSFAVDPHKWMAVPVGCGASYVRDGAFLARALTLEPAAYVEMAPTSTGDLGSPFDERGEGNPDLSLDHSAPSRGLTVWAALKEMGASGMRARVVRHHDCARRVAARVGEHPELELLAEPVLSICCFRVKPKDVTEEAALDALNEKILLEVRARGRAIPSHTRVNGRFAIRPCFINPRSTLADADATVDEVLAVAGELGAIGARALGSESPR
ncbi:MAG TPA: aminotransferase class V-fold PLP-dependent enzyme [Thermoanaerobaculia bacterium]|nr:aminotransferase class V-fold PLP-dependent enzyme [Thermoanaerobaculia bacterium]